MVVTAGRPLRLLVRGGEEKFIDPPGRSALPCGFGGGVDSLDAPVPAVEITTSLRPGKPVALSTRTTGAARP